MVNLWQETPAEKPPVVEGTHYSVPIQIEYEDDWQRELMEHRSPADVQERSGEDPLAQAYPLEREGASTLTWETFMDTVAFPEKSIPKAMECEQEWTQADVRDALLETLQDTVLCGTLARTNQEVSQGVLQRAMMDDILDDEEEEL